MLKYLRNKTISVERGELNELKVHGVLDDDLYGVTMDAVFDLEDLAITAVTGSWHRWTTPECHRTLGHIKEAVGLKVGPGYRATLQKGLGRSGCRHFANLLIEMGHAAGEAALVIGWQGAVKATPDLSLEAYFLGQETASTDKKTGGTIASATPSNREKKEIAVPARPGETVRQAARGKGGFVVDLHVHTSPASPCSSIGADELIKEAMAAGLNGLVFTDHNHLWAPEDLDALRQKHGFLVLGGNEIITDQGDVLVYGYDRPVTGVMPIDMLRKEIQAAGGYMTMAHPFRGFLIFGAQQLGLSVEKAAQRKMFRFVDAIEVGNGKVTAEENDFASRVAEQLRLPGAGGSDAHESGSVGGHATCFPKAIHNERELVEALHAGEYIAV